MCFLALLVFSVVCVCARGQSFAQHKRVSLFAIILGQLACSHTKPSLQQVTSLSVCVWEKTRAGEFFFLHSLAYNWTHTMRAGEFSEKVAAFFALSHVCVMCEMLPLWLLLLRQQQQAIVCAAHYPTLRTRPSEQTLARIPLVAVTHTNRARFFPLAASTFHRALELISWLLTSAAAWVWANIIRWPNFCSLWACVSLSLSLFCFSTRPKWWHWNQSICLAKNPTFALFFSLQLLLTHTQSALFHF